MSPLGCDGIYLVNEDDGGGVLLGEPEHVPHHAGPLAQVFLDKLGSHHTDECGCNKMDKIYRHGFGKTTTACYVPKTSIIITERRRPEAT